MRTKLESLVLRKTLEFISVHTGETIFEAIASGSIQLIQPEREEELIKNVCAKVPVQLSDEIDKVCGLLHVSKREFIQSALVDAVNQANNIMHQEGLFEALQDPRPPIEGADSNADA